MPAAGVGSCCSLWTAFFDWQNERIDQRCTEEGLLVACDIFFFVNWGYPIVWRLGYCSCVTTKYELSLSVHCMKLRLWFIWLLSLLLYLSLPPTRQDLRQGLFYSGGFREEGSRAQVLAYALLDYAGCRLT